MKKKKLPQNEKTAYVYFGVLLAVMIVLVSWPSIHRAVLTHPEGMTESEIREKEEITIIGNGIIGKWQSTDDSRYIREFTEHEVIEWYDGVSVSVEPYTLFEGDSVPSELVPDAEPYLVYAMIGTANSDPLLFSINKFDFSSLDMFYLGRGEMLRFTRI